MIQPGANSIGRRVILHQQFGAPSPATITNIDGDLIFVRRDDEAHSIAVFAEDLEWERQLAASGSR